MSQSLSEPVPAQTEDYGVPTRPKSFAITVILAARDSLYSLTNFKTSQKVAELFDILAILQDD